MKSDGFRFLLYPILVLTLVLSPGVVCGEIVTDGSVGPAGTLAGPQHHIPAEIGLQVGGNLFHSFARFNLDTGQSAEFTGPDSVQNIINRVTGGAASHIDGLLRSHIPKANLFLLNPWGVIFGPNAALLVDGAFHVSTASTLFLGDGGRVDALSPESSSFTAAPPEAFGFLGENPGTIRAEGMLIGKEGETVSVVGGDIEISGGAVAAAGGKVNLTGAGPSDLVPLDGDFTPSANGGEISITDGGKINVSGVEAGDVYIRGGRFTIDGPESYVASVTAESDGGGISVRTTRESRIQNGGRLLTTTSGTGKAGDISLDVGDLRVDSEGMILSGSQEGGASGNISIAASGKVYIAQAGISPNLDASAYGNGNGGDIQISADEVAMADGGGIQNLTLGDGSGGDIDLKARHLTMTGKAVMISGTAGSGDSGEIAIAADGMELADGALIQGSTAGAGKGGWISVSIKEGLAIQSEGEGEKDTGIFSETESSASAGDIDIRAREIRISGNGAISSETAGAGAGGKITIAADRLEMDRGAVILGSAEADGNGGSIDISVNGEIRIQGTGRSDTETGIYSRTESSAMAGDIRIDGRSLYMAEKGQIRTAASARGSGGKTAIGADRIEMESGAKMMAITSGPGDGGDISLTVNGELLIRGAGDAENDTGIYSKTESSAGSGKIDIRAQSLGMEKSAVIYSLASGAGSAGDISVAADRDIHITGASRISSNTWAETASGGAGEIRITAQDLKISEDGMVSSQNRGDGRVGSIHVGVDRLEMEKGYISSTQGEKSLAGTRGGDVDIKARESVRIAGSGQDDTGLYGEYYGLYAQTQGAGDGGNIAIETGELAVAADGMINGQAFGSGRGGDVVLKVDRLAVESGGTITVSTRGAGDSGDIAITAAEEISVAGSGVKYTNSWIYTATHSRGHGGDIRLMTPSLTVKERGTIYANTLGDETYSGEALPDGDAGHILIQTDQLELTGGGAISAGSDCDGMGGSIDVDGAQSIFISGAGAPNVAGLERSGIYVKATGTGDAGQIDIRTPDLQVKDRGAIDGRTLSSGDGKSVNLSVDRLLLENGGAITVSTHGSGKAGDVSITASDRVEVRGIGEENNGSAIHSATYGTGDGGTVNVTAPDLSISNGGSIYADSIDPSPEVRKAKSSSLFGKGGDIRLFIDQLELEKGGAISAGSRSNGSGGSIGISAAGAVLISGSTESRAAGDKIRSGIYVKAYEDGHAGEISIRTPDLRVTNDGTIDGQTLGSGKGGRIALTVDQILLEKGGTFTASAYGEGSAGDIAIDAADSIRISGTFGTSSETGSGIYATTEGDGSGGTILLAARNLTLADGAEISTATFAGGTGGDIRMEADAANFSKGSAVTTRSTGTGYAGNIDLKAGRIDGFTNSALTTEAEIADGGNIDISAGEWLELTDSWITTRVGQGKGDGGNITISGLEFLILKQGNIIADAFGGDGGNIHIATDQFVASSDSIVSASSQLGIDGTIHIDAPDTDISGSIVVLPQRFFDAAGLLTDPCAQRTRTNASTLVRRGSPPPQTPAGYLCAPVPGSMSSH